MLLNSQYQQIHFDECMFSFSIILIIFLILIVEGTLYDVIIIVWPKIKHSRKKAGSEKQIDDSRNSSDSNYKLRSENEDIQQPKQKKHNPSTVMIFKQGNVIYH